jgi:dethiobiotin synthetase
MKTLLITGTDTEVGKTVLTTALAAYWQSYHPSKSLGLIKLIQTGIGDHELYDQLFSSNPNFEIEVPLRFQTPVAPPIAAEREGRTVALGVVWQAVQRQQKRRDIVLIEALGGLGTPLTPELTVADIARDWHFPVVLVVPVKLGAIAQTVSNVALARQSGIVLKGIILNCIKPESEAHLQDWTPVDLMQSLTNVPVLGVLPYLIATTDLTKLTQVAANLDLEQLAI